jgi:hypothetical protein
VGLYVVGSLLYMVDKIEWNMHCLTEIICSSSVVSMPSVSICQASAFISMLLYHYVREWSNIYTNACLWYVKKCLVLNESLKICNRKVKAHYQSEMVTMCSSCTPQQPLFVSTRDLSHEM